MQGTPEGGNRKCYAQRSRGCQLQQAVMSAGRMLDKKDALLGRSPTATSDETWQKGELEAGSGARPDVIQGMSARGKAASRVRS